MRDEPNQDGTKGDLQEAQGEVARAHARSPPATRRACMRERCGSGARSGLSMAMAVGTWAAGRAGATVVHEALHGRRGAQGVRVGGA
jgi:hypothetical protein